MKSPTFPLPRLFAGLCTLALMASAAAADDATGTNLPDVVPFQLGDSQFAPGDSITITRITGTQDTISPGGTYCVDGQYTLASHDSADLALFMTVADRSPTSVDPRQTMRIEKGSGSFRLIRNIYTNGFLHISFYPSSGGGSFGGIHFGQGQWVLHNGDYSLLGSSMGSHHPSNARAVDEMYSSHHPASERAAGKDMVSMSPANLAMLEYLGSPVEAPTNLADTYTPAGLREAIETAARQAGVTMEKVEIEDSEFPALVGVICDRPDYAKLMAQIKKMTPYTDEGSVGSPTCQTMNIIPWRAFPDGTADLIERRLTLREQMFHARLSREAKSGHEAF